MIHQRVHRCPRDAVVTGLAHIGRGDMRCTFAGRNGAIMTGRTHALHLRVVDAGGRRPRRSGMTGVAKIGRSNVSSTTTGGNHAIMTGCAGAGDFSVIHCGSRCPGSRHMAGNTIITCRYVRR